MRNLITTVGVFFDNAMLCNNDTEVFLLFDKVSVSPGRPSRGFQVPPTPWICSMLWSRVAQGPVADWAHQGVQAWFRWRPKPVGSHSGPFTYSLHSLPCGHDTSKGLICLVIFFRRFFVWIWKLLFISDCSSSSPGADSGKACREQPRALGCHSYWTRMDVWTSKCSQWFFVLLTIKWNCVNWQSLQFTFQVSWRQQEAAPVSGRFSESSWTGEELQLSNVRRDSQVSQRLLVNSSVKWGC